MITKSVPARAHTRTFAVGVDYITQHMHQRAVAMAGHSFERGVNYASAPEKAEWVHLRGVMSVETAAIEMEAVAALSSRCRDPVYHLIIAYAKHERPTREQVISDAERLLKAIGMEKSQYALAAHKDTDDFHAHVIANRFVSMVGPTTCGMSGSSASVFARRSRPSAVGTSSWATTTATSSSASSACTSCQLSRSGA